MTEKTEVTEAPKPELVEEVKASDEKVVIETQRQRVERELLEKNSPKEEQAVIEAVKEEVAEVQGETPESADKAEKPKEDDSEDESIEDPVERIKKATQKRIDKLTAKSKSAEEELAEAKAEIERLKAQQTEKKPEEKSESKDNKGEETPTPEQVEAYIVRMREEGNVKEEIAATRYLIKLEKEMALKEVEEKQKEVSTQSEREKQQQLKEWTDLAKDYEVIDPETGKPDLKSDMTLSNQQGLLYKLALDNYNNKELHAQRYNDPNVMHGFRRAVADAYRQINEYNRLNPKDSVVAPKRNTKAILADPDASFEQESTTTPKVLSDAEKVRAEINARRNRNKS